MSARTGWVDSVKGLTIILVVAHHALLSLDVADLASASALYWDDLLAAIRMPLFFMVAGLFARKAIEGPWAKFLDSKLIHFGYFYLLWSVILFGVRYAGNSVSHHQTGILEIVRIAWDPISTIWFMYALALTFGFARMCRTMKPQAIAALAFAIQAAALALPPIPNIVILNKFSHLILFFVIGVYCSGWIRERAARATALSVVGYASAFCLVALPAHFFGMLFWPVIYPIAALAGIGLVVALISTHENSAICRSLAFVGTYSLPIYLSHFLPVAAIRLVLVKVGVDVAPVVYLACIVGSVCTGILAARFTAGTPLAFLFDRPKWARVKDVSAPVHAAVSPASN